MSKINKPALFSCLVINRNNEKKYYVWSQKERKLVLFDSLSLEELAENERLKYEKMKLDFNSSNHSDF